MKSRITILAVAMVVLTQAWTLHAQQDTSLAPTIVEPTLAPVVPAGVAPVQIIPVPVGFPPIVPASFAGEAESCTGKASDCACPKCRRAVYGTWGSVSYMHAWTKGRHMPILATTSPAGTSGLIAGVLGNATTSTVFGGGPVGDERQSAGRIDFGVWLDDQCGNGVGVRLFGIEGDRTNFVRSSRGLETIAVPFYNIDLGAEDATLASLAPVGLQTFGDFGGSVNIFTQNDLLMGEIYARLPVHSRRGADLELIGGYHYVSINDGVNISSFTEFLRAGIFPVGTTIDIFDSFSASNEFHGAALGMTSALHQGCWSLKGLAKVSIGSMHQEVLVRGQTITDVSGGPMTTIGTGLFAQDSNGASSPAFERDEFTYIPEVELTLGYQLTDCVQLTAGYSFIYFPNVVLAGNQIDRYIDLPPQAVARPAFVMQDTDFWVQGVNLGLTWEY